MCVCVCVCVSEETKTVATSRFLTITIAGAVYAPMHNYRINQQSENGIYAVRCTLRRRVIAVDTGLRTQRLASGEEYPAPVRCIYTLRPAREYMCALHRENRSRGGAAPLSRSRPSYATRTRAYYIIIFILWVHTRLNKKKYARATVDLTSAAFRACV